MSRTEDRQWWPFAADEHAVKNSIDAMMKVKFLTEATRFGCKAFVQNIGGECGAIGDDGRECLILLRTRQRAEVFLQQSDELKHRRMFYKVVHGEALNAAAAVAIQWLKDGNYEVESDQ
jgi:hypothetical protein